MQKTLLFSFLLFAGLISKAQEDQINVNSKITNVTVFRNGAQVQRQGETIDLPQGTNLIVFAGLASTITAQSIQAKGEGNFTILSVSQQQNFLKKKENTGQVTLYKTKVDEIVSRMEIVKMQIEVAQQEEEMLVKNQSVMGPNLNYDLVKLKQALDFQKQRLVETKTKQIELNKEFNKLQTDLNKYTQQINELNSTSFASSNDVVIKVEAKQATKAKFSLSYMVTSASWYPSYDIRAKDIASPIELVYKANVVQNSGEDWKNIKLYLSSGNPVANNSKPNLMPYTLGFVRPRDKAYDDNSLSEVVTANALQGRLAGVNIKRSSGSIAASESAVSSPIEMAVLEKQTNVVFDIKNPYTILTDGKYFAVDIANYDFKADYEYYAAPKLREDAFLTAKINGFNRANLINGEANIFFDGTYLGKTALDFQNVSDTLTISLGIDKNVIVKREKLKDFNERQFIGSSQKDSRSFTIELKNRKSQPINITIQDQLPISTSDDITVERQELSKASISEFTGILTWKLQLQPNEQKKLTLKYVVKYPKSRPINLE